jgi:phenylalanyl-tRNA synthetase beta chain
VAFTVYPADVPVPKNAGASRGALEISDLQAVERDLAFVLDARVAASDVVNAAQGADKAAIEAVRVFDEFVGGSLGEGRKSLAITLRIQPRDKTLTEEQIEAIVGKVIEKVAKATGGTLRG